MPDILMIRTNEAPCAVCSTDTPSRGTTHIELLRFGSIGIAVPICRHCEADALVADGDLRALADRLRDKLMAEG